MPFAQGGRFDNLLATFMGLLKGSKKAEGVGFEIQINKLVKYIIEN